jgi:hypothetical protein
MQVFLKIKKLKITFSFILSKSFAESTLFSGFFNFMHSTPIKTITDSAKITFNIKKLH